MSKSLLISGASIVRFMWKSIPFDNLLINSIKINKTKVL